MKIQTEKVQKYLKLRQQFKLGKYTDSSLMTMYAIEDEIKAEGVDIPTFLHLALPNKYE